MSDDIGDAEAALDRVRAAVDELKDAIENAEHDGYRVLAIVHSTPSDVDGVHVHFSANRSMALKGEGYVVDYHAAVRTVSPAG